MKNDGNLIESTESGLFCPESDIFIDLCRPVERAVITHAHSAHVRTGCVSYLATPDCAGLLKARLETVAGLIFGGAPSKNAGVD